jgi:hypothetical protein
MGPGIAAGTTVEALTRRSDPITFLRVECESIVASR